MANRRSIAAAMQPFINLLADITMNQYREQSARRLATENDQRQMALARYNRGSIESQAELARKANAEQAALGRFLQNPRAARRAYDAGTKMVGGIDLAPFMEQDSDIAGELAGEAGKADNLSKLMTNTEGLNRYTLAGGKSGGPGGLPFSTTDLSQSQIPGTETRGGTDPASLLMASLESRRGLLTKENLDRLMAQPHYDVSQNTTGFEAPGRGFVPTAPTPAQKGANDVIEYITGKGSPNYTKAQVQSANELESGTRPEKVLSERALAEAHAQGTAAGTPKATQTTDAERKASVMLPGFILANAEANELEKQGVSLTTMSRRVQQSPLLQGANSLMKVFDAVAGSHLAVTPAEEKYARAVTDFSNTFGYLRSGVAVREDEFDRFVSTFFAMSPNDPALEHKQAARQAFLEAAQIATGRSGYDAGLAIGNQVKAGMLTKDEVSFLKDPDILRGISDALSGKGGVQNSPQGVQFDPDSFIKKFGGGGGF